MANWFQESWQDNLKEKGNKTNGAGTINLTSIPMQKHEAQPILHITYKN